MQHISDDTKIPSDNIKISCRCHEVRTVPNVSLEKFSVSVTFKCGASFQILLNHQTATTEQNINTDDLKIFTKRLQMICLTSLTHAKTKEKMEFPA